jgi:hypothetical protein
VPQISLAEERVVVPGALVVLVRVDIVAHAEVGDDDVDVLPPAKRLQRVPGLVRVKGVPPAPSLAGLLRLLGDDVDACLHPRDLPHDIDVVPPEGDALVVQDDGVGRRKGVGAPGRVDPDWAIVRDALSQVLLQQ